MLRQSRIARALVMGSLAACATPDAAGPSNAGAPPPAAAGTAFEVELDESVCIVVPADDGLGQEDARRVEEGIQRGVEALRRRVPLTDMVFLVGGSSVQVIPSLGVGGFCADPHKIEVAVDPQNENFDDQVDAWIPRLVVHEVHHALRYRAGNSGFTLLDMVVNEGLADHFMVECLGCPPPPWSLALDDDRAGEQLAAALDAFDEPYSSAEHARWFFGRPPEAGTPAWTGYALGWRIVERYLADHPEARPSTLDALPAPSFLPSARALLEGQDDE